MAGLLYIHALKNVYAYVCALCVCCLHVFVYVFVWYECVCVVCCVCALCFLIPHTTHYALHGV